MALYMRISYNNVYRNLDRKYSKNILSKGNKIMELVIRRTILEEAEEILSVQKKAFKDDLEKYKDFDTNPGNEPIKRLLYKIKKNIHYTVLINDTIIGAAEIRIYQEVECYINRIFLLPNYQGQGLGTHIMNYFEKNYPNVKKWTLCSPHKNYSSHIFYEKLGYKKVGEHKVTELLSLVDYLKEIE